MSSNKRQAKFTKKLILKVTCKVSQQMFVVLIIEKFITFKIMKEIYTFKIRIHKLQYYDKYFTKTQTINHKRNSFIFIDKYTLHNR